MSRGSVTLIGTGALACFMGARLARSGYAVTWADTWLEAIKTINRDGLVVEDGSGCWAAAGRAVHIADELEPADLVFVLVKSSGTHAVAETAARAATPGGMILTLQNGLGNVEILRGTAGTSRVALGVPFLGATLLGPGRVRDGGGSGISLQKEGRIAGVAEVLRAAGFEISLEADIAPTQWAKLAANCSINPLTALLQVPNGALLEDTAARSTLESAAREVGAVAAALGIRLHQDAAEIAIEVARRTAINRSSMLQDVERGVTTEIEALNGAVVREAERLGVAVPVNHRLLEEVRKLSLRPAGSFPNRGRAQ